MLFSAKIEPTTGPRVVAALAPLFEPCHFSLHDDVDRVELAIAEPKEVQLELSGKVSVEAVRCVLESLKQHGALEGIVLEAVPFAHGVRIATPGAIADGPGAPSALARRFSELLQQAENAGVADLAPGGSYEFSATGRESLSFRVALRSPAEAMHAAAWLKGVQATEPSGRLSALEVAADGASLNVRATKLSVEQALALREDVVEAFRLPSASMLPTLLPGDHIYVRKGPTAHVPARGDVVVFTSPREASQDFVKRVIGIAGDHVEIHGYAVRVNGRPLDGKLETKGFVTPGEQPQQGELWSEALGDHHYRVFHDASHPSADAVDVTVEPDHVFVVGDNRDNSFDSRQFGSVPVDSVKGQAVMVWASFDEQSVRWERFGTELE